MSALSLLVWVRPGVTLGLVLCGFVLEQWAQAGSGLFVSYYQLTNYATGLIVVMGFTSMMIQRQMRLPEIGTGAWLIIVLYIYAAVSVIWSIDRGSTIDQYRSSIIYLLPLGFVAPLTAHNTRAVRDGLVTFVLLGSFLLVTLVMNPNWGFRGVRLAVEGTTGFAVDDVGNPLEIASMGGYLVIVLALLRIPGLPSWASIFRWGMAAFSLLLIIYSGSRGQFFGAVAAVLMFVPLAYRLKSVGGFFSIVVLVGLLGGTAYLLLASLQGERFALDVMVENYSSTRLDTTMIVLSTWWDAGVLYWLVGLGSSASFSDSVIGFYPHFVPGEVLGELGLIGFSIYALAYVFTVIAFWRTYQRVKEYDEPRSLLVTLGSMFFFYSLLTLKQGSLIASIHIPLLIMVISIVDREVAAMVEGRAVQPAAPVSDEEYAVSSDGVQAV